MIAVCGTEGTRTTKSLVRATLAPGASHIGTPEAARIPPDGVGFLTRSLARHRLSELSPHHLARAGSDQGGRKLAD
jgi:hypothetical protein